MDKYMKMKQNNEQEKNKIVYNRYIESWQKQIEKEHEKYILFMKSKYFLKYIRPKIINYKEIIECEMAKQLYESRIGWKKRKEEIDEENRNIMIWNKVDKEQRRKIYHQRMQNVKSEEIERKKFLYSIENTIPLSKVFQYYNISEVNILIFRMI